MKWLYEWTPLLNHDLWEMCFLNSLCFICIIHRHAVFSSLSEDVDISRVSNNCPWLSSVSFIRLDQLQLVCFSLQRLTGPSRLRSGPQTARTTSRRWRGPGSSPATRTSGAGCTPTPNAPLLPPMWADRTDDWWIASRWQICSIQSHFVVLICVLFVWDNWVRCIGPSASAGHDFRRLLTL